MAGVPAEETLDRRLRNWDDLVKERLAPGVADLRDNAEFTLHGHFVPSLSLPDLVSEDRWSELPCVTCHLLVVVSSRHIQSLLGQSPVPHDPKDIEDAVKTFFTCRKWKHVDVICLDGEAPPYRHTASPTMMAWQNALEALGRLGAVCPKIPTILWSPSPPLEQYGDLLPVGGVAVDVRCGSGRDTCYIALKGLDVTAVDCRPDAPIVAKLQAHLPEGVPIAVDLVHVSRFLERTLTPALIKAVKPGGYIFYSFFMNNSRHPTNPARLLRRGELQALTQDALDILWNVECTSDDGSRIFNHFVAQRRETAAPV